jgi:hypothetical protein
MLDNRGKHSEAGVHLLSSGGDSRLYSNLCGRTQQNLRRSRNGDDWRTMKTVLEMPRQTKRSGTLRSKARIGYSVLFATLPLTLALVLAPGALAQGITGSITGTVTDPSGAAIAGATVTTREVETNAVRTVTTSDIGTYTVTQLLPGH